MKRAQRTDLLREMKKSFNRYISILSIIMLGVAFYAGVRSAEPDMQLSTKKYLDETNYMDIRVIGTLGVTEEDMAEISEIEGILQVEGGYQTEMFLEAGQRDYQMSVFSLGDVINQVYVTEGRLPENAKECFADRDFLTTYGYKIGDVISLRTEKGEKLSDILAEDTFTIVGAGLYPEYLSWQRGAVSIGTGVEDGFLFLPKDAFSLEVYTVIYATAEGAKDYNPFTEEYEDYIGGIVERIEAIADARCEIRYGEVTEPYWEDILEAEADIAKGEKELADGEKELADGERELADAEAEIADGEKEIADAEKEIADGEKEIADAEKEIADGEKELADALAELIDGEKEIADGGKELADAWTEILDGEKKIADGEKELADAEEELKKAEQELSDGEEKLKKFETQLGTNSQKLATAERDILAAKQQCDAFGIPYPQRLLDAEAELNAGKAGFAKAKAQIAQARAEFEDGRKQYEEGKAEWEEGLLELEEAKAELADGRKQYEEGKAELEQAKLDLADGYEKYEEGLAEIEQAKKELQDGRKELEEGRQELADAKQKLEDGRKELEEGKKELAEAKQKMEDARIEIADAKVEIEDGRKELEDGKLKLSDARKELEDVELPEWYVLDRGTVQQIVEYGSNAERVGNLGDVFPAVFYLVAALVSLTTMTRMIEEERTQIGTMKALGYSKGAIVSKYLWYSMSATLVGGLVGVVIGSFLFPWVLINAYGILYTNIPYLVTPIQPGVSLVSVLIAVGCNLTATLSSCYKELVAAPAVLMRPVAPPAGKRVFLEYIKPLWNALNFSWKATCRNLFRYKKRFFMTIFGIGGCMALLLVGFGIRDSIMDIVKQQFEEIWTYDAYLSISEEDVSLEGKKYADKVERQLFIQTKTMDMESEENQVSAVLFVPEKLDNLEDFVVHRDRISGEKYTLTGDNVIITEKLAKLLDVSVGDTIFLHFDDVTKYEVTVDIITENYISHYVYISAEKYRQVFGEVPEYNQLYLKTADLTEADKEAFSEEMLSDDAVDSVTYVEELQADVAIMMRAMELVIVVLIIAAGMLAFIVLYNLNNINIIERRRELATLKVLGFYDIEVGNYVYRENALLTILGTVAGIIMGFFLHRYVIFTVEVDMMMFGREIKWPSYIYSVLLTGFFAVLINFGMFFKLRKIDMVESLKSAE